MSFKARQIRQANHNSAASKGLLVFDFLLPGCPGTLQPVKINENEKHIYVAGLCCRSGDFDAQHCRSGPRTREFSRHELLVERTGQDFHEKGFQGRNDGSRDGKIG